MSITTNTGVAPRTPLRLWPGVAAATLLVLIGYVLPAVAPTYTGYGFLGAVVCGLLIIVWWLFFSRARWYERVGAVAVIVVAEVAQKYFVHTSIAGGAMGNLSYLLAMPTLSVALVAWAWASRRLAPTGRGAAAIAAVVLACLPWTLVRTGGISAEGGSDFHWRWTPTPEDRLLAQVHDDPSPAAIPPAVEEAPKEAVAPTTAEKPLVASTGSVKTFRPAEWPGFRGAARDGVIHGTRIQTDWATSPPVKMWNRPIGPGWSSFSVRGDLLYTQEQRGRDEVVACYRVSTGAPVWRHRDAVRFYESNGGPGPRATPTIHQDRVYAFGATGVLNALDARTGAVAWSRNVSSDAGKKVPMWGFASSPLIVDDLVIVAAAGNLAAFDLATGNPRWMGPNAGGGYSSPHLFTKDGVRQVVLLSTSGATAVAPADGKVLWEHKWGEGTPIVQPAITPDGDILINALAAMGGLGIRRLTVARAPDGWKAEERWTSTGLKPYFNDFVIHKGHAFGFDGNILSCIDLADGSRKWKGGRYGNGQLVLLPDQDLLLIISEDGELALVKAATDGFTEVSRFKALDAKTWNHPVLIRDVLLVRNGEEMAAFRLPLEGQ